MPELSFAAYTRQQIERMPAGRELDKLVDLALGWTMGATPLSPYSSKTDKALLALESYRRLGAIEWWQLESPTAQRYDCSILLIGGAQRYTEITTRTFPLAVARAIALHAWEQAAGDPPSPSWLRGTRRSA